MIERFEQIREHFEREAAVFDGMFFKVMPRYEELLQALVESLPFPRNARLAVADLGCGTGNLALKILDAYPRARVTCVDMAENMLIMARSKLQRRNAVFWQGDIREFPYERYDAVVSSLVMHHIERRDKPVFYRKLFKAVNPGGVFYNIDIFLSSNEHLQKLFMERWKEYMRSNGLPARRVNEMIMRHQREDRPVCFTEELEIMRRAGFTAVDVVKKHYNFAVYGGINPGQVKKSCGSYGRES